MSNIHKLIFNTQAFDFSPEAERLFELAMHESFNHHYNFSVLYKKLCDKINIKPWNINSYKEIPYTFVTSLKSHKFITGSEDNIKISLSSSGTGGKKTFIYLDEKSLERISKIVREIFYSMGMVSSIKNNYICFTYDPEVASDVGTAFSDKMLTGLTEVNEVYYTNKYIEKIKDFELDIDGTIEKLKEFSQSKYPLRILGFPAHLYFTLEEYYKRGNKQLNFSNESFVITGGGWKNHTGIEIPKEEFKGMLADMLGIPVSNIRDHFGMVEHGIPYVDCEYGKLHIPTYSRAFTYDPIKQKINDYGAEGLLMLFSPYCNSYPSISLLSTDKAIIHENCECGRGPYIELRGRAGNVKHKGCAIIAMEKLRGQIDNK